MTGNAHKEKMLAAHLCGDRVLTRPAPIGVRRLPDLKDRNPRDLMHQSSLQAGRPNRRAPVAARAQTNRNGAQRRTAGG